MTRLDPDYAQRCDDPSPRPPGQESAAARKRHQEKPQLIGDFVIAWQPNVGMWRVSRGTYCSHWTSRGQAEAEARHRMTRVPPSRDGIRANVTHYEAKQMATGGIAHQPLQPTRDAKRESDREARHRAALDSGKLGRDAVHHRALVQILLAAMGIEHKDILAYSDHPSRVLMRALVHETLHRELGLSQKQTSAAIGLGRPALSCDTRAAAAEIATMDTRINELRSLLRAAMPGMSGVNS